MSNEVFAARLQRIATQAADAHVVIPGQVGEPERRSKRVADAPKAKRARTPMSLVAILFGGIIGAFVGLAFQHFVGVEVFSNFDWRAEWALIERDVIRGATWGAIAAGLTLVLLTWPKREKFRKLASGSVAYVGTAVCVNAQDIVALMPVS